MAAIVPFKVRYAQERRAEFFAKRKTPEIVPIILTMQDNSREFKYLIQNERPGSHVLHQLRTDMKMAPSEALFVYIEKTGILLASSTPVTTTYEKYKDSDGFLYLTVAKENTFG